MDCLFKINHIIFDYRHKFKENDYILINKYLMEIKQQLNKETFRTLIMSASDDLMNKINFEEYTNDYISNFNIDFSEEDEHIIKSMTLKEHLLKLKYFTRKLKREGIWYRIIDS